MSEQKRFYLGTGTEFNKAQCREYKTIEGALRAAAKDESLVVWDEDGNVIGSLTDKVPEDALETHQDGSVNAYNEEGSKVGTVDAETVAAATGGKSVEEKAGEQQETTGDDAEDGQNATKEAEAENGTPAEENGENGANTESKEQQETTGDDKEESPAAGITNEQTGKFGVEVVCGGSLRLRRSASWDNSNECGRASKGQTYIGKRLFMLDGVPMLETIDGLFMSAAAEHVKIVQM